MVHPPCGFCFSGVPVSSRVSAKIQQLVNTLKRPKRPPLREFFVDDFEELLEGNRKQNQTLSTCSTNGPINNSKIFFFIISTFWLSFVCVCVSFFKEQQPWHSLYDINLDECRCYAYMAVLMMHQALVQLDKTLKFTVTLGRA